MWLKILTVLKLNQCTDMENQKQKFIGCTGSSRHGGILLWKIQDLHDATMTCSSWIQDIGVSRNQERGGTAKGCGTWPGVHITEGSACLNAFFVCADGNRCLSRIICYIMR